MSHKQAISSWEVVVYDDCVRFKRVDQGQMQEAYPPVPTATAAVYAAAIVHGLQPPRDIRLCGLPMFPKPAGTLATSKEHGA